MFAKQKDTRITALLLPRALDRQMDNILGQMGATEQDPDPIPSSTYTRKVMSWLDSRRVFAPQHTLAAMD